MKMVITMDYKKYAEELEGVVNCLVNACELNPKQERLIKELV